VPGARKVAEACNDEYLTLKELIEEREWCWDKSIYKRTKTPIVKRTGRLADVWKTEV